MTEAQRPHRPVQPAAEQRLERSSQQTEDSPRPHPPGEAAHAHQLLHVPQADQRVGAPSGEVFPRGVELDADAVGRVSVDGLDGLQLRVTAQNQNRVQSSVMSRRAATGVTAAPSPQDVDAAVAVGQEEHVVVVVPGDLVHLELELLLRPGAVRLGVDEGHHVVFVPDGDGLAVRTPADVDVLTWKQSFGYKESGDAEENLERRFCRSDPLPFVLTVAMHLVVRTSQMRMVLSPDAVTNRSGLLGCQHS